MTSCSQNGTITPQGKKCIYEVDVLKLYVSNNITHKTQVTECKNYNNTHLLERF